MKPGRRGKVRIDTGENRALQHACPAAAQANREMRRRDLLERGRATARSAGQILELSRGYDVRRSRRSVSLTRIGNAVSCQPAAIPIKLDQNAIHMRAGTTISPRGSSWVNNVSGSLWFRSDEARGRPVWTKMPNGLLGTPRAICSSLYPPRPEASSTQLSRRRLFISVIYSAFIARRFVRALGRHARIVAVLPSAI